MTKHDDQHERRSDQPSDQRSRRPYRAPKLTEYGPIAKLTRSGSGSVVEGSTPQSKKTTCL